jgi:hypothetical protein
VIVTATRGRTAAVRTSSEMAGTGDQVKIAHAGVFAAMLVPAQQWRSIVETLDILADADAVNDILEADEEIAAGAAWTSTRSRRWWHVAATRVDWAAGILARQDPWPGPGGARPGWPPRPRA